MIPSYLNNPVLLKCESIMIQTSVIPDMMNNLGVEFFDVNDIPITICEKSSFLFNYSLFQLPYISIDSHEKRKYKKSEIRPVGLEQLKKLGYQLVKMKTTPRIRNRKGQAISYQLEHLGNPIPNSEVMKNVPQEHSIEYDLTNNCVRLKGANGWPYSRNENATLWVEVPKIKT
jgi:hypothetical protein